MAMFEAFVALLIAGASFSVASILAYVPMQAPSYGFGLINARYDLTNLFYGNVTFHRCISASQHTSSCNTMIKNIIGIYGVTGITVDNNGNISIYGNETCVNRENFCIVDNKNMAYKLSCLSLCGA
ncbi:hypothetical protein M1439_03325 [Candidatus Marsarchaeota archaeon]|nr:hypothetical protein [Candidatus Marsarchaeota archaeon]